MLDDDDDDCADGDIDIADYDDEEDRHGRFCSQQCLPAYNSPSPLAAGMSTSHGEGITLVYLTTNTNTSTTITISPDD